MYYINNDIITTEKFDLIKFMELGEDMVADSLSSYVLYRLPYLPVYGKIILDSSNAGRPDLISYYLYGDTQYWWIVMWYNGIYSVKDLTAGRKINYPSLGAIEELYLNTNIQEKLS